MDPFADATTDGPAERAAILRLPALLRLTDERAMRRVSERADASAFALLLRRWRPRILGLCARMTGDPDAAEDLTQETFARLYAARASYRGESRFSTWLWRIAVNVCYDELRARRRHDAEPSDVELDGMAADEALPDEVVAGLERAEAVRCALSRLPEHYRAVVVLRHYEGLKFREIAETLDIPEGTVKSRMAEALDRLSALLAPRFGRQARKPRNGRRDA